jgi:hypothetical protein
LLLAGYLGSQTILLWHPGEITLALTKGKMRLLVEADSIRRLERLGLAARDRERPFAEALTLSR